MGVFSGGMNTGGASLKTTSIYTFSSSTMASGVDCSISTYYGAGTSSTPGNF
jgi:hypothetical protein